MTAAMYEWKDCPVEELYPLAVAGAGSNDKTCDGFTPPQSFVDFASSIIEGELGYVVDHWRYWASNLAPVAPEVEWQLKFPHTHQWDGYTLVLYLNKPESGGELVVLEDDIKTEKQRFEVRPGMAALMSDHMIHGVKAIRGNTNRVTMIAGAYPYPPQSMKCRCENKDFVRVTS